MFYLTKETMGLKRDVFIELIGVVFLNTKQIYFQLRDHSKQFCIV